MFVHGRTSYIVATILAFSLHVGIGYTLWHYKDHFLKATSILPSLQTTLVNDRFEPLALQTNLIIEKPKPIVDKVTLPPPSKKVETKIQPKPKTPPKIPKKEPPKIAPKKVVVPKPIAPEPTTPKQSSRSNELDGLISKLTDKPQPSPQTPAQPLTPEMRVAGRYVQRIQKQIESAWIQPPNVQYREMAGLAVLIRLTLNSSGELIHARILNSSGNPQYDRSALNAVYRVGTFQVPTNADIFDRFFRQVNINYSL